MHEGVQCILVDLPCSLRSWSICRFLHAGFEFTCTNPWRGRPKLLAYNLSTASNTCQLAQVVLFSWISFTHDAYMRADKSHFDEDVWAYHGLRRRISLLIFAPAWLIRGANFFYSIDSCWKCRFGDQSLQNAWSQRRKVCKPLHVKGVQSWHPKVHYEDSLSYAGQRAEANWLDYSWATRWRSTHARPSFPNE